MANSYSSPRTSNKNVLLVDDEEDSSDDDEGDDFLTHRTGSSNATSDREAMVRQKLMENFYGKSAVHTKTRKRTTSNNHNNSFDDEDDDDDDDEFDRQRRGKPGNQTDDLDSPTFDATAYTTRRIQQHSVQELLETEETVALQVRTLDSTMQTLVYENYNRFIDATDAIKSIGIQTTAHHERIQQLLSHTDQLATTCGTLEDAVQEFRDPVAEKIRIQRLLTRLDTLLKLPSTLQHHRQQGQYRVALHKFYTSARILAQHSPGFESLQKIETECAVLLEHMKQELQTKLHLWSGTTTPRLVEAITTSTTEDEDMAAMDANVTSSSSDGPSIAECVGAWDEVLRQDTTLTPEERMVQLEELQSMASTAFLRWLDRLLDTHLIRLQEDRYNGTTSTSDGRGGMDESSSHPDPLMGSPTAAANASATTTGNSTGLHTATTTSTATNYATTSVIATDYLNAVLEVSQLWTSIFFKDDTNNDSSSLSTLLELVSEALSSFLTHTESILLDPDLCPPDDDPETSSTTTTTSVPQALVLLVQSIQQVANGLTDRIPEKTKQGFVQQAERLCQSMVRRKVESKFDALKCTVCEDCLIPLAQQWIQQTEEQSLAQIYNSGVVLLSDIVQLVDGTIESLWMSANTSTDSNNNNATEWKTGSSDLKQAVRSCARQFAFWLANALERLAGGDDTQNPEQLVQMTCRKDDVNEQKLCQKNNELILSGGRPSSTTDNYTAPVTNKALQALMEQAMGAMKQPEEDFVSAELCLVLAGMCHEAETLVSNGILTSFKTHLGGGVGSHGASNVNKKTKSNMLFPSNSGGNRSFADAASASDDMTRRFELARSTVLFLYATQRGHEMAQWLCQDFLRDNDEHVSTSSPQEPQESTRQALGVAKRTCEECVPVLGGDACAGPVPAGVTTTVHRPSLTRRSVSVDIERMFHEQVMIYPHFSEVWEATRNAVLFLTFKTAVRAWMEVLRFAAKTEANYRQGCLDLALLQHMLPHYIKDEAPVSVAAVSGLLDEVHQVMRVDDPEEDTNERDKEQALRTVSAFLEDCSSEELAVFVVSPTPGGQ